MKKHHAAPRVVGCELDGAVPVRFMRQCVTHAAGGVSVERPVIGIGHHSVDALLKLREEPVLQTAIVIESPDRRSIRGVKLGVELRHMPWLQFRLVLQVVEEDDEQRRKDAERAVDDKESSVFEQCLH